MTDPKKISDLKPAPYNPRSMDPESRAALERSIREFGDLSGIVFNFETGNLITGHQRRSIMEKLSPDSEVMWEEEDVGKGGEREGSMVIEGHVFSVRGVRWPREKEELANLIANSPYLTGEFTSEADRILADIIESESMPLHDLRLEELQKDLQLIQDDPLILEDDLEELEQLPDPPEPISKPGELWILGDHRILCADARDKSAVHRLLQENRIQLIVTDPPYGVEYEGGLNKKKRKKIAGDQDASLYSKFLQAAEAFLEKNAALYMWFAGREGYWIYKAALENGWNIRSMIIWNKLNAHYGSFMAQYLQKHEPCLYCYRGTPKFVGATNEVTVWDLEQPHRNELHPAQKPFQLMFRPMRNHKAKNIYDPFVGSGTSIVAAEKLKRRCFAMDIDPLNVDICIRRWEEYTKRKAELCKCINDPIT
jgi:DNA modification methylase